MTVDIVTNRIGVPSLVEDDGSLIYLTNAEIDNLAAIDLDDPSIIESLYDRIKVAVSELAGINPDLPLGEWMQEYNQLSLINEFQTALFVMNQARIVSQEYREVMDNE